MTKFIYADVIPPYGPTETIAFTAGKRYEVLDEWGGQKNIDSYIAEVRDDNCISRSARINAGCAYLDGGRWNVVIEEI